jgi:hypothetical protein
MMQSTDAKLTTGRTDKKSFTGKPSANSINHHSLDKQPASQDQQSKLYTAEYNYADNICNDRITNNPENKAYGYNSSPPITGRPD